MEVSQIKMSCLPFVAIYIVLVVSSVLGHKDPYSRIESESADVNTGTSFVADSRVSDKFVGAIQPGDVLGYHKLNFSAETVAFQMSMSGLHAKDPLRNVYLRLDTPTSQPFLTYIVETTGDWFNYVTVTIFIPFHQRPRGVHDLYFTFTYTDVNPGVVNLDWFTFIPLDSLLKPCTIQTVTDCPRISCKPLDIQRSSIPKDDCDDGRSKQPIVININYPQ